MKKILLLLLFTVASYGQAVFDEGIQITGNANSATATKVNVQEANGKVNTQTIKTGFNKNIGLGGSDVVGATTLLNQYSTTPIDWTATAFDSGQVVFYAGKQWIAKIATVAGDVPAVSSKWEEITFEALANKTTNKTTTVDQTIIDGSTNAVSSNAVFDGLAGKANLSGGNTFIGNQILPSSELQVGVSASNSSIIYFRSGGITAYGNGSTTNKSFELSQGAESQGGFSLGTNTVKMYMREYGLNGYSTPIRFNNSITSTGYVKEGGLASQFLKADGTVDSNTYLTSASLPTVDQTIIDGSTNAVSSNAVFDGLALKSNIGHTHVASQITDLSKASVGLGNVDNTSDLSKPLSTATINALATKAPISSVHNPVTIGTANGLILSTQQLSLGLASSGVTGALSGTDWNTFNGKFNTPTGLTTNYMPKWNGSGFGNSGFYEDATGLNINGQSKGITFDNPKIGGAVYSKGITYKIDGVNKWSINVGAGDVSENYNIYSFDTSKILVSYKTNGNIEFIPNGGRILINKTDDDLINKLQVAGTISAAPATTANQVPTWGQVQAMASSGTYTPSNQTNADQTVNFMRSYWVRNGNVLTVTTSLTYTVTQIQSTASFTITLPNNFLVSGASGRIIGSSLLHNTQAIFNNNANMKAYETPDSSQINLQANFQATASSGTYETTIIYTVLIQ